MASGEAAGHLHKENEDYRGGEEEVNVDEGSRGPVSGQKPLLMSPLRVTRTVRGRSVTPFDLTWVGTSRRHGWQWEEDLTGTPDASEAHTAHRGLGAIRCECWASIQQGPHSQQPSGVFPVFPGMATYSLLLFCCIFVACLTFLLRWLKCRSNWTFSALCHLSFFPQIFASTTLPRSKNWWQSG